MKTISMPIEEYEKDKQVQTRTGYTKGFEACVELLSAVANDPMYLDQILKSTSYPISDKFHAVAKMVQRSSMYPEIRCTYGKDSEELPE